MMYFSTRELLAIKTAIVKTIDCMPGHELMIATLEDVSNKISEEHRKRKDAGVAKVKQQIKENG